MFRIGVPSNQRRVFPQPGRSTDAFVWHCVLSDPNRERSCYRNFKGIVGRATQGHFPRMPRHLAAARASTKGNAHQSQKSCRLVQFPLIRTLATAPEGEVVSVVYAAVISAALVCDGLPHRSAHWRGEGWSVLVGGVLPLLPVYRAPVRAFESVPQDCGHEERGRGEEC